jgi:hypothetical protein
MAISVFALVGALDIAQVGGRLVAGDCSFGDPGHGRGVVTTVRDGGVLDVMVRSHDHDLPDLSRVFQVAVGDVSRKVIGRHQSLLDLEWKGESPDVGQSFGAVIDATHASLGCVGGTGEAGVFRRDLRQVSGTVTQARG